MQEPTQPSTANIAAACAIMGGVAGYMIGQAKSLGLFGGSALFSGPSDEKKEKEDDSEEEDEEESSDEEDDSVPTEFPEHKEECKMVLVVRTDLGMTKGTPLMLRLPSTDVKLTIHRQNRRAMWSRSARML